MHKTKKVKLFHSHEEKKSEPVYQLDNDDQNGHIEQLRELLMKATQGEYQTEKKKLTDELDIIRKQLQNAKTEYDDTMADLVPLKWELVDKRSELTKLQDQYKEVLANLKNAKDELQLMNRKLGKPCSG